MASLPQAPRGFLHLFGPFLGVIGILILFGIAINAYLSPIESFCAELPPSATSHAVLDLAKSKGLPAFNAIETKGVILVSGHRSPFFRHTCEVEFDNGRQVGRRVIADG